VATSPTREKREKGKRASVKIGKKEASHLEKNR
jgi:hypothetical protein